MFNQANKFLILALGIAIGVIGMLLLDRGKPSPERQPEAEAASVSKPVEQPSLIPPMPAVAPAAEPAQVAETVTADDTAAFEEEMRRILRGEASEDEQLAFWQEVQTSKRMDALISQLQGAADADPADVASRLTLAQAYITKVWSAPAGPAQGLWAGKAEALWKEVLETDSENWDAQRNIAFSYSQYPDFLNKTGAAISEYEKAIALQESASESRSGFAKSYLELAKLHLKNGDPSNALATLENGTAQHPGDEALQEQLKVISSSYKFEE